MGSAPTQRQAQGVCFDGGKFWREGDINPEREGPRPTGSRPRPTGSRSHSLLPRHPQGEAVKSCLRPPGTLAPRGSCPETAGTTRNWWPRGSNPDKPCDSSSNAPSLSLRRPVYEMGTNYLPLAQTLGV